MEKRTYYVTTDGRQFLDLKGAQLHEEGLLGEALQSLLNEGGLYGMNGISPGALLTMHHRMVTQNEQFRELLQRLLEHLENLQDEDGED